jgi:hypothetical protein
MMATHDLDVHRNCTRDGWITSRVHLFVFSCDQKNNRASKGTEGGIGSS